MTLAALFQRRTDGKEQKADRPALEALREADPEALSPKDALDLLYKLKRLSE